jgi:Rrf2 family protein
MKLALARRGSYAVQVAVHLAHYYGCGLQKRREIAAAVNVPSTYLPHILATMVRQGLLTAVAGPSGGYVLARQPAETSLLSVIEATEGPVFERDCLLDGEACNPDAPCELHNFWMGARGALIGELSRTTLADVVNEVAGV